MGSRQQRRQRRDIERRLRELDRLDQKYGLGAHPAPRRPAREWRTVVAAVIALGLTAVIIAMQANVVPVAVRNAVGLGPHPLGHPPTLTTTGAYAFLEHQHGDPSRPVAWDPCKPVRYQINTAGGPPDAAALVADAVGDASQATGLKFEYVGQTDARPHWKSPELPFLAARHPVLVSWATESEVPQLAGRVAGIGGALAESARDGRQRYVTGGVTLDLDAFHAMDAEPNGRALERAIVLHELGHLVGLAHVTDPNELMYADNVGKIDYGPGDRAGLARLGSGPCF